MATIGTKMTLLDYAKRLDPSGKIARIVEMLTAVNEVIGDMVVVPGNTQTGHKTTIRTGLPTVAWRQINKGTQPSKSTTKQIEFTAGLLEGLGKVDEELVALAEDKSGFRLSENAPFLEAIAQTLATTIFYGDTTIYPDRFMGLAKIYAASTGCDAATNVLKAGGSGSVNTSMYLICWGENTIHGFFPKATQAGIQHNDLGLQLVNDDESPAGQFRAWVDQYKAKLGLAVRDWRFGVRIANIDITDLETVSDETDTSANLIKLMVQAMNKIPNLNAGNAAWYCNKEVKTALELKALDKSNVHLSLSDMANGNIITRFLGVPIRRCDALLNTEETIS